MKAFVLSLIFYIFSSNVYAKFTDEYLDQLIDDPDGTLAFQKAAAKLYKKTTKYNFNPLHLNLIGALARREYERNTHSYPRFQDEDHGNGHTSAEDFLIAHRYEGIARIVHRRLREIYGNKILEKPIRVINNVGGIYATMEIYNCSLREYMALFGTILPQTGYSGSYSFMRVWDVMVDGEMYSYGVERNKSVPISYGPGEYSLLNKKERRVYKMGAGAMMLDYGRGFIPPALVEGVFAPFSNNLDSASMRGQIFQCAKSFIGKLKPNQ